MIHTAYGLKLQIKKNEIIVSTIHCKLTININQNNKLESLEIAKEWLIKNSKYNANNLIVKHNKQWIEELSK